MDIKESKMEKEMLIKEKSLKEKIKKIQKKDERVVKVVEELKRSGVKTLKKKE